MGISRLQGMLAEVALHLESRFRELEGSGKVVRLDHAFSAFSGDIIGRICLGTTSGNAHEPGDSFLNDENFAPEWYDVINTIVKSIPLFTGFPWIVQIASILPENVLLWAFPRGQMFNIFKDVSGPFPK